MIQAVRWHTFLTRNFVLSFEEQAGKMQLFPGVLYPDRIGINPLDFQLFQTGEARVQVQFSVHNEPLFQGIQQEIHE